MSKDGIIKNEYDYDIFGRPILTIENESNAIRYAGEFYDEETGLYYLRARYYNPYIGRFISEDSYWGEDINPLSLNLYTYCFNDPIRYVDPTGHKSDMQDARDNNNFDDVYDRFGIDKNADKDDIKDTIIELVDDEKVTWWEEEQGKEAGSGTGWTGCQKQAHKNANDLRELLSSLESGSSKSYLKTEMRNKGGVSGDWEKYKMILSMTRINKKVLDISNLQKQYEVGEISEKDYLLQYDNLEKVSMVELSKYHKRVVAANKALSLRRNVFEKDIVLNESQFKHTIEYGVDYNDWEIALNTYNGVYYNEYNIGIKTWMLGANTRNLVPKNYNYKEYMENRFELFGSEDDSTWVDYMALYGASIDMHVRNYNSSEYRWERQERT